MNSYSSLWLFQPTSLFKVVNLCAVLLGAAGEEDQNLMGDVGQDARPRAEAEEKLKRKEEELDNLTAELKLTEEMLTKERNDAQEALESTKALSAEAEDKLRKKQEELDKLVNEREDAERKLKTECDDVKAELTGMQLELERTTDKLNRDTALKGQAEEKLRRKQ